MIDLTRDGISQKLLGSREPQPGCPVCGSQHLYLDEVGPDWTATSSPDQAGLLLGECQRCDYRWTLPMPAIRPLRGLWARPESAQEHAA